MARISDAGLAMLKEFEGCRLTAYQDAVAVWTIGYGHTGADVTPGLLITQARAEALLRQDLARFEVGVEQRLKEAVQPAEFDALVSFAYNVGLGAFGESTLLKCVNRGDHAAAVAEFRKWVKAGDQVLPGLVRRREAEALRYRAGGRAG